jgi:hypothetical protein
MHSQVLNITFISCFASNILNQIDPKTTNEKCLFEKNVINCYIVELKVAKLNVICNYDMWQWADFTFTVIKYQKIVKIPQRLN